MKTRNKLLLAIGIMVSSLFLGFALSKSAPIQISASSSEESSLVQEEPVSSEQSEEKPEEDKTVADYYHTATDWIENKIIPIIGGFSIGTGVSIIVSIATAVLKWRWDKRNNLMFQAMQEEAKAAKQGLEISAEDLRKAILAISEAINLLEQSKSVTSVTLSTVREQLEQEKRILELRETLRSMMDLMAKTIALSKEAVESGMAEDAMALVKALEGGNSDGGEG